MINVLSALYGCKEGGADVTEAVKKLVANGNDDIKITNDTMGGDPCKGTKKYFAIKYRLDDGKDYIKCCKEDETLDLVI